MLALLAAPARAQEAVTAPGGDRPAPPQEAGVVAKDAPVVSAGSDGFSISSSDGAFRLSVGGYLQFDYRWYPSGRQGATVDTFLLRRARATFAGTVYRFIDFRFVPDFGEGKAAVQDAYVDVKVSKTLLLRAGRSKPLFGLERQISTSEVRFAERGLASGLTPNRDLGASLIGDTARGIVSFSVGVHNGVADGGSSDGDDDRWKDVEGRVFLHPFARSSGTPIETLSVGVAVTDGRRDRSTQTVPSYKTAGQQIFFKYLSSTLADGRVFRIAPQVSWTSGPLGMYAETIATDMAVRRTVDGPAATMTVRAWHVAAVLLVTGERETLKAVSPARPFLSSAGGWGALEIAGRIEHLAIGSEAFPTYADPAVSAREANAWGLAATWYLTRGLKINASFEHTSFTGGTAGGSDRATENSVITRLQVAF
jgi:phosphate-selective porin OprO/OprP